VCGNVPSRGEKRKARGQPGLKECVTVQAAECERWVVIEAVTREMEAPRRGILRGVRSGVRGKAKVRRFFFGVAVRGPWGWLRRWCVCVCVLERDLNALSTRKGQRARK
jgi:hypothetical protein